MRARLASEKKKRGEEKWAACARSAQEPPAKKRRGGEVAMGHLCPVGPVRVPLYRAAARASPLSRVSEPPC